LFGEIYEWLKYADCKSVAPGFEGSNPSLSTINKKDLRVSYIGITLAFQANETSSILVTRSKWGECAHLAQSVEHFLGKEEVGGSNPLVSSIIFKI
jgi:hypothetical protein